MTTPFWFVVAALVFYAIAYLVYGRWYDRTVWRPDPKRTTPAHMYMDGVEFFPASRYVLWGYQFKSVAALGPILGPFIALQYGWLPALIWIILGNFFIGWLQDYGAIMVSVRNNGRSFGPIAYEFTGASGRSTLLGFILFYLQMISATFVFFIAQFWNSLPGTFAATVGVIITAVIVGQLMYKVRLNVGLTTLIGLVLVALSVVAGVYLRTPTDPFGAWSIPFWAALVGVFLFIASVVPLPSLIQPMNFISFFPTFLAVLLIIVGGLLSPVFHVPLQQPAWKGFWSPNTGPLWPMMFLAIACGAISGWHSLVGSSTTAKQLDLETDAHPVGAGAMLSEGLVALASLAAYMVLAPGEITKNTTAWVAGAIRLTEGFLGGPGAAAFLATFFGVSLVLYAITVQSLVTRFWRLISAEVAGQGRFAVLGQKHVATFLGILIAWLFAVSGSWNNLWLYFGGSNQLLAGLALMLVSIHLARARSQTGWTFWPAMFMIVTTILGLAYQTYIFAKAVYTGKTLVQPPLGNIAWAAHTLDGIFTVVGVVLIVLGVRMAIMTLRSYFAARARPVSMVGESASPAR